MFLPDDFGQMWEHIQGLPDYGPITSRSVPLEGLDTLRRAVRGMVLLFITDGVLPSMLSSRH